MSRPDIRELECFVAVAEELSFAKASRRIHLSQPPLSRHIQKLESKLGVSLLRRNTRIVELTAEGAVFLEDARFLLRHLDRAVDTVKRAHSKGHQVLNFGFVGAMLEGDMIEMLRDFRAKTPGCQIRLHDMNGPELVIALGDRLIDGAFIGTKPPALPREMTMFIWKSETLTVALPEEHRLAQQKTVDLQDLAEENWVMIERNAAPTYYRHFQNLCAGEGFRPKIILESPKIPAILAMVAAGEAVTMLYESTARSVPHVVFLPLRKPKAEIEHAFVFRAANESAMLREFVKTLPHKDRRKTARPRNSL